MDTTLLERCEVDVDLFETKKARKLHQVMQKFDIRPFSLESQRRYESEIVWSCTPPIAKITSIMNRMYHLSCTTAVFFCFITAGDYLVWGSAGAARLWSVCAVSFFVLAGVCYPASSTHSCKVKWYGIPIESYMECNALPFPGNVLRMANDIKEDCPGANLTIWIFTLDDDPIDKFLFVEYGGAGHLIEKWRDA